MPQPGLHALLALASRRRLSRNPGFATGVVLGSLLPDLDGYAAAFGNLVLRMNFEETEHLFHRTLTHSLLLSGAIALFAWYRKWWMGLGLALGMALFHTFLDIFAWFDGVGILWPFASIDLWHSHLTPLQTNLLRAGNFFAFWIYLEALSTRARYSATSVPHQNWVRWTGRGCLGLGILFVVFACILSTKLYGYLDGAALLLFAYPAVLMATWRMRETIEA